MGSGSMVLHQCCITIMALVSDSSSLISPVLLQLCCCGNSAVKFTVPQRGKRGLERSWWGSLIELGTTWEGERDKPGLPVMSNVGAHPKLEGRSIGEIPQSAPRVVSYNKPHWECFCTNINSMRNKQGELKALAQSQGFDIIWKWILWLECHSGCLDGSPTQLAQRGSEDAQNTQMSQGVILGDSPVQVPSWTQWSWWVSSNSGYSVNDQKIPDLLISCFVAMKVDGKSLIHFVLIKWNTV